MADDDEPAPRTRVTGAGERSIQLIVDRRLRSLLDRRLRPLEERLAELVDGKPAAGADSSVDGGLPPQEALASVVEEVARLNEVIDRLVAVYDQAPAPFHWDDLEPAEREKRWETFTGWVDTVLRPWLPRQTAALKACWDDHPGVVYLLTAAWFAWGAAARSPGRKGPEMLTWMKDMRTLDDDLVAELGHPSAGCKAHPPTRS